MKLYSTGQVADLFGVHRDKVDRELRNGAPQPSANLNDKRGFTRRDVVKLAAWFQKKGIEITAPIFTNDHHEASSSLAHSTT